MKNLWFPKETVWGVGHVLGVWDGNPIKLDCDDHCTTINVIKFTEVKNIYTAQMNVSTEKKIMDLGL